MIFSALLRSLPLTFRNAMLPSLLCIGLLQLALRLLGNPKVEALHADLAGVAVAVILLVQMWLTFGVIATALAAARGARGGFRLVVPLRVVWRVIYVNVGLFALPMAGTAIGGLALLWGGTRSSAIVSVIGIVVGFAGLAWWLYLGVLWSQTTALLIDGKARRFDAAGKSAMLTDGWRGQVFALFFVVGIVQGIPGAGFSAVSHWPTETAVAHAVAVAALLGWKALCAVFSACVAVALYLELRESQPA